MLTSLLYMKFGGLVVTIPVELDSLSSANLLKDIWAEQ